MTMAHLTEDEKTRRRLNNARTKELLLSWKDPGLTKELRDDAERLEVEIFRSVWDPTASNPWGTEGAHDYVKLYSTSWGIDNVQKWAREHGVPCGVRKAQLVRDAIAANREQLRTNPGHEPAEYDYVNYW